MDNKKPLATKIAIIGAGSVGSTIAYVATLKNLAAEISLIDINVKKEEGEVMDIADGMCFVETGCVKGTDFASARDADIIVYTAGAPQAPGETRLDLATKNRNILKSVFKKIARFKNTAIVIIVANPVDALTAEAIRLTQLPRGRVFGTGTALDTARLRTELSHLFKISAQNVHGFVLGEHGNSEFVAWSSVTIGGIPTAKLKLLTAHARTEIETRVRQEAYEIISRKNATFYGIGLITADIIEAVLFDQKKILPISILVENWNDVDNIVLGVPAILGRAGVEKIWPLILSKQEQKKLTASAAMLKKYEV
ncbi:MAG: L-lactate dehydrogenase [Candidatus Magasanikbacteria bacterium RIFCSPHIGHO2_01_FULL_41_23]|uniref:L-lactate dehydrogenase n=1 Tax=Candidatus Magasanikbacteria bacterium RIFCSPLOWO2_01_FULL_40_15 TaxID=1798686 RepID=A0A1F6N4G5_9BACT|nr:MAG: L-lactate dehydrogenase [Candidatus Magasanikbacteria bacterium RIFCSPHIGHO2_01_FULL_41_23]OGH66747.1 MAG: L-lactate dehydrogenase [Candidatus Magasanikbacteria bacterium RIFCSPHIGHO2_02_FULL_41_35]OGH74591.1 MAG: L-lactate dehydrogenase [Candidatus Magasanikbacteria bacterium RIFCSPHIGHO2_12_FULL_41_16]OGH78895.1 MAG: L-lactate dehydrogenase [Candidatus Magasanikbacteria bacterium RIFCSPLOWO2_01_FULL_40_15]